jgi:hypothetical protein
MKTIERNYTKKPHTARFLQTFYSANGANNTAEAHAAEDLLETVPVEAPAFQPNNAQASYITNLIIAINAMDQELGAQAADYVARMQRNNAWTAENTSRWIDNLKAKRTELWTAGRKAASAPTTAAPAAEVKDGRYAVEEDGVLKFFKVTNGRKAGFVFLDVQASDEWHAIRNVTRIRAIIALIAVDQHAAMVRYGHELGECGRCGRTLTDEASRAAGIGPICAGK